MWPETQKTLKQSVIEPQMRKNCSIIVKYQQKGWKILRTHEKTVWYNSTLHTARLWQQLIQLITINTFIIKLISFSIILSCLSISLFLFYSCYGLNLSGFSGEKVVKIDQDKGASPLSEKWRTYIEILALTKDPWKTCKLTEKATCWIWDTRINWHKQSL